MSTTYNVAELGVREIAGVMSNADVDTSLRVREHETGVFIHFGTAQTFISSATARRFAFQITRIVSRVERRNKFKEKERAMTPAKPPEANKK